jgi:hypothetical protein
MRPRQIECNRAWFLGMTAALATRSAIGVCFVSERRKPFRKRPPAHHGGKGSSTLYQGQALVASSTALWWISTTCRGTGFLRGVVITQTNLALFWSQYLVGRNFGIVGGRVWTFLDREGNCLYSDGVCIGS